ncbi:hypothetical protein PRIPAC_90872, partial [Pristionchus pacificus]
VMPNISIYNAVGNLNGKFVEVKNVSNHTYLNENGTESRDNALTSFLVSGYLLENADTLLQAVCAVVNDFEDQPAERKAPALTPQEKENKIKVLRMEEEERPTRRFSRECRICFASSPKSRAVLTACGHTACMACVLHMEKDGRLDCPYCRKRGGYVKLHEEHEDEEKNTYEKDDEKEEKKE